MSKAIIIGSGIAGIATAIRLRAQGFEVDVYESNSYPGGKLSTFSENGFRFDAGPSLFTMPELVEELFGVLNEKPANYFKYRKLDIGCHYFYEDGTFINAPTDIDLFAKEVGEKMNENPEIIKKYFRKSALLYRITAPVFLENSLHQLSTYLNKKGLFGIVNLWRLNLFSTMHKVNSRWFKNVKTIQLFDRFATYNGSNPYMAPATLNVIPHLEFGMGVYFPEGGMVSITNALVALAERHGVQFHYNSKVNKILVEKKQSYGVEVNGKKELSDLVVCNMDVYPAYKNLLSDYRMPERVSKVDSSSSALVFYWGIQGGFGQLGLHNIFFAENYKVEFDSIFNNKIVHNDPTVYINITSKLKPDDAPEGCENWFVMINVPANQGQNWDEIIGNARLNILRKISRILKTDIEHKIISESVLDPRSIELKTSSYRGALYGSSSNKRMAAFFRHPNFKTDINRLYFCGGSVHPGGGIPLCLLSARITGNLINKKKGKE